MPLPNALRMSAHNDLSMSAHNVLRIALFTYSTQPRGGVLHALALADALHALGHDVVLHALDDTGRGFIRRPRCPVVLIPVEPRSGDLVSFAQARIAAYVNAWNTATQPFDLYHAHDGISGNALATLMARGDIAQFVRTVHHIDAFAQAEIRRLEERAIVAAAQCFVVSRLWRDRLAATYNVAATVVSNGVDTARFRPVDADEQRAIRAALGFGGGPLFVTIGGVEARKNTRQILEAFARVRATLPAARLVVAGGASVLDHSAYRREFDARAAQLGVLSGDSMHFTGVLSDRAIVALLQAAHALIFPSLVEGFGLVILEALACGTPVVTSAIAPFTEYLDRGDALLVDPHNADDLATAMLRALEPEVAAAARANGPALARRFAWDASASRHAAAYRQLRFAPKVPSMSEMPIHV